MSRIRTLFAPWRGLAIGVALVALVAACGGPVAPTPAPEIASFTATPSTIAEGESSTLAWEVTGSATIVITDAADNEIESTSDTTGSVVVSPTVTTTYTLTASNAGGSDSAVATVTVEPASADTEIEAFTATPSVIGPGGSSTLAWAVTGDFESISLTADPGGEIDDDLEASGDLVVQPDETTEYTLTVHLEGGAEISATATVTVSDLLPAEISNLTSTIVEGSQVLLEWEAANATSFDVYAVLNTDEEDAELIEGGLGSAVRDVTVRIPESARQTIRVVANWAGDPASADVGMPANQVVVNAEDYDPYNGLGQAPEPAIAGSLRAAVVNAPNGSVIGFASDITEIELYGVQLMSNGEGIVDAHLAFGSGRDLIVSGPEDERVVIRGVSGAPDGSDPDVVFAYQSRVVFVHANATIGLQNLVITGGTFIFKGGGVRNDGELTITNSVITENRSWEQGGGIFNTDGATLTLIDSVVSDNRSVTEDDEVNATLYIRGEDGHPDAPITLNNSGYGGGLFNEAGGTVTLTNTSFTGNEAKFSGGAIYNVGDVTASDSPLQGNQADHRDYDFDGDEFDYFGVGGAIATFGGELSFGSEDILDNVAADQGGGLTVGVNATAVITGVLFNFNEADFGGAIRHVYCEDDTNLGPPGGWTYGVNNVARIDAGTNNISVTEDCPLDDGAVDAFGVPIDVDPRARGEFYLPPGTDLRVRNR